MIGVSTSVYSSLMGTGFSPASIFTSGSEGIWLEPSDLTTMFQDRAGTTPVTTPGQTVGLRLDKSKGLTLGSELVTNGDFSGGSTTGWLSFNSTLSIVSGNLRITATAADASASTAIATVVGRTYLLNATLVADAMVGNSFLYAGTVAHSGDIANINLGSTPRTATMRFVATTTTTYISISGSSAAVAGGTLDWDNISVKEIPGNHAVAPTDAARPTYGIEPKTGRRNLLTRTEEFGDAVWTKSNVTLTENAAVAPNGTMTAESMIPNTTGSVVHGINERPADLATVIPAGTYTVSVYAKSNGYNWFRLRSFDGTSDKDTWFNLSTGQVGTVSAGATPSITSLGSGWYRCSVQLTTSTNISLRYSSQFFASPADNTINFAGNGTSGILLWGAQLELGSTATAYQRVGTAFDVTEAGVPTVHYVQYDGTDDSFSTSSINFTATDKMSVFAGVRKLGDGMIAEFSASADANNGSFYYYAGNFGAGDLSAALRGSALTKLVGSAATLPVTRVESVTFDIAGTSRATEIFPRINGASVSLSGFGAADAGTGNFGNYPLFIGRRNNASFPFNGRDYGIIIVGKVASATEITNTESYLAANTSGVTL